ncbi:MAG: LOW QUALITY PROTEIN: hypothetical protein BJ554DRAFT_8071, partial [Olpidium bornovanus]
MDSPATPAEVPTTTGNLPGCFFHDAAVVKALLSTDPNRFIQGPAVRGLPPPTSLPRGDKRARKQVPARPKQHPAAAPGSPSSAPHRTPAGHGRTTRPGGASKLQELCLDSVTQHQPWPTSSPELPSCPRTSASRRNVTPASRIAFISEELCIGCGICPKKCPFGAIHIVNLPTNLEKDTTHRYSANSFKLHRLPVPRPGQVLGLVGTNGIGKSTALKVLAGKLKPNLGNFEVRVMGGGVKPGSEGGYIFFVFCGCPRIIRAAALPSARHSGRNSLTELQNYFTKILEDNLKAIIKPQYVDHIPRAVQGSVLNILNQKTENDIKNTLIEQLGECAPPGLSWPTLRCGDAACFTDINCCRLARSRRDTAFRWGATKVCDSCGLCTEGRNVSDYEFLEGLRDSMAILCDWIPNSLTGPFDSYMFDEPSSYLDVKQRLNAARTIRSLLNPNVYVIVVEHDLSVLDYLSDFICVLYGMPSIYGVVTLPFSVREGINIFLDGMVPTENLRFREESLTFRMAETAEDDPKNAKNRAYKYPAMAKKLGDFTLDIEAGEFTDSEILVLLGQNGTGKVRQFGRFLRLHSVFDPDWLR